MQSGPEREKERVQRELNVERMKAEFLDYQSDGITRRKGLQVRSSLGYKSTCIGR